MGEIRHRAAVGLHWGNLRCITRHPPVTDYAMISLFALNEAVLRCLQAGALCYHLKSTAALVAEKMFPATLRSPHLVVLC